MTDERYTVFDVEACGEDGDGHRSGLSLEQAARELLERSGSVHEIRREGAYATLYVSDGDGALVATDIVSAADEPAVARREIYERVVRGDAALPGPFMAVTDRAYRRELARLAYGVDDAEADLLVKLGNGHYHTLLDHAEQRLAEGLFARGIVKRLRQRHKGHASLYRLAQPDDDAA